MSHLFAFSGLDEETAIIRAMLFVEMITVLQDAFGAARVEIGDVHQLIDNRWSVSVGISNTPQTKALETLFHTAIGYSVLDCSELYFTPN